MTLPPITNVSHLLKDDQYQIFDAIDSSQPPVLLANHIATIDHVDYIAKERIVSGATTPTSSASSPGQAVKKVPPSGMGKSVVKSGVSSFKNEPTILPKSLHIVNAPMRIINIANSPRSTPNVTDQANYNWLGKRANEYIESELIDSGKRIKKTEKGGKGLRHFSMKVCEKVQRKGVTSYNEVADELVAEFSDPQRCSSPTDQAYDQKNIRRRVYDALNVLMAMNIISKEKKEIRWLGLPTNSAQECHNLEQEKQRRLERIRVKTQQMHELILQQIAFKNLVQRNYESEKANGHPVQHTAIQLPFIIVNTAKNTVVDCSISNDKTEYLFNFDNTFEILDDIEVLKRMGMTFMLEKGECTEDNLERARKLIPKALEDYVKQIANGSIAQAGNSIIAGPSGITASETHLGSDCSDNRTHEDGSDLNEYEMTDPSEHRLSRQSSITSLSDQFRMEPGSTSDDEDFLGSESEDVDEPVEN